jgi:hypothetical protein
VGACELVRRGSVGVAAEAGEDAASLVPQTRGREATAR